MSKLVDLAQYFSKAFANDFPDDKSLVERMISGSVFLADVYSFEISGKTLSACQTYQWKSGFVEVPGIADALTTTDFAELNEEEKAIADRVISVFYHPEETAEDRQKLQEFLKATLENGESFPISIFYVDFLGELSEAEKAYPVEHPEIFGGSND